MKSVFPCLLFLAGLVFVPVASGHHSFAVFDFDTQIAFEGTVLSVKFRNPHIAMTLDSHDERGQPLVVNFIEGAPANMLVRSGLRPEMIAVGTRITAVGSPLMTDKNKFFLRKVILQTGEEY
ncbi:MAG: DUF6152 family protein [Pseudomonadales bacterium]|nr:DUF6152 family protein [Pseudomonadales bacterium]